MRELPPGVTVDVSASAATIRAPYAVPFEATGDARHLREVVRGAIAALDVPPGALFGASFRGARRAGADVENLLLYNIDESGRLFDGGVGVRFEHDPKPAHGVEYAYRVGEELDGFDAWHLRSVLAAWDFAPLPAGPSERLLARTWWAITQQRVVVSGRLDGPVGLRLRVRLPESGRAGRLAGRIKGLVDGVVCALSRDAGSDRVAALRVADQLGMDSAAVISALAQRDAPFGDHRLLVPRGRGVQWLPPDDRLVAGLVTRDEPSTGRLEVAGELLALERSEALSMVESARAGTGR